MKKHTLNDRIKGSTVRLVGHETYKNNIIDLAIAKRLARDEGLDLVLMNTNESAMVCKIMDYNKFQFNQKKGDKKKAAPKLKEIKFTPNISENDLGVKVKQARKFLAKGSTINVHVSFK